LEHTLKIRPFSGRRLVVFRLKSSASGIYIVVRLLFAEFRKEAARGRELLLAGWWRRGDPLSKDRVA